MAYKSIAGSQRLKELHTLLNKYLATHDGWSGKRRACCIGSAAPDPVYITYTILSVSSQSCKTALFTKLVMVSEWLEPDFY